MNRFRRLVKPSADATTKTVGAKPAAQDTETHAGEAADEQAGAVAVSEQEEASPVEASPVEAANIEDASTQDTPVETVAAEAAPGTADGEAAVVASGQVDTVGEAGPDD